MRRFTLTIFSFLMFAGVFEKAGHAQDSQAPRVMGNAFFGAGIGYADEFKTGMFQLGGGSEARVFRGLTAGGELGYLYPAEQFRDGFGLFSANGYYHFPKGLLTPKTAPFVTAGYSAAVLVNGQANLANFGLGTDYWIREKVGLRFELRDYFAPGNPSLATSNYLMFRVGVVWR